MIALFRNASLLIFTLIAISGSHAQTFNLADDWSDTNNPNGAWTLYKAPGQLFTINQPDWYGNGTNQPAWADSSGPNSFPVNPLVPLWAKAIDDVGLLFGGTYDGFVDVGTVFMHSAESFRTGTDFTSVVWTSPRDGIIRIDGGLWIAKAFDRPHTWELRKNGTLFTSGSLSLSDPYTKADPFAFSDGSGGNAAVDLSVAQDDEIELLIYRPLGTLVPGTLVGLNYQINFVPEPTSYLLLGLGTLGIITMRR